MAHRAIQQLIFFEGDSYFTSLLADLRAATHTIELETYIFATDELSWRIAHELSTAAKRGVTVRVLVDGAGSPLWGGSLTQVLEQAGAQTRIFHPFPWRLWQWSHSYVRISLLLKAIYLLLKINSRNHRKVCVIDRRIAYIGSFNITADHLSERQGGKGWRDTGIRITGVSFKALNVAFEYAWNHVPVPERWRAIFRHVRTNPIFRLNYDRHRRRNLYKDLLQRIAHCRQRIWMTNAYFVPDNFLLQAIAERAKAGVDVRILLPRKSDVFFMPWASSFFYRNLLKAGVRIFEYLPSFLHAKTLILDDWMLVGSSNLNHRSLLHDLEVDVNIRDPRAKQHIETQFLADSQIAEEISLHNWHVRPAYQRLIGRLLLYLKFWI